MARNNNHEPGSKARCFVGRTDNRKIGDARDRVMEPIMKAICAALTFAILVAATWTQPAAAVPKGRYNANQSRRIYSNPDYTQSGPNHTGPLFRGYPLSDWYIFRGRRWPISPPLPVGRAPSHPLEADQREQAERRHRLALDEAHAAVAGGPLGEALPAEFRPPAEPARHRRKALLDRAHQAGLGAEMVDQDDL